jgi:hypothetical protein
MMGIVVKQKECVLPTEGLHNAVISRIEDMGIVETATGKKDMARIFFTTIDPEAKESNEAFLSVNKVLNGNGNLSKLLKSLKISDAKEFRSLGTRGRTVLRPDPARDGRARSRKTGYHRGDIEPSIKKIPSPLAPTTVLRNPNRLV